MHRKKNGSPLFCYANHLFFGNFIQEGWLVNIFTIRPALYFHFILLAMNKSLVKKNANNLILKSEQFTVSLYKTVRLKPVNLA